MSKKKILIAYASRAGSTAEVAEKICKTLRGLGLDVDVKSIKGITNIDEYNGVIIGSAIRMFKLLPEVVNFAKKFKDAIKDKPVAYFIVCLLMKDDNEKTRSQVLEYLKPLLEIKEPVSIGLFGGKMDYSKLSLIWRILFKRRVPEGDFRNWKKITDWTNGLLEIFN